MDYIVKDQELAIQYWPGKGAWTYHLVIPNSRAIPGTWGHIKASGTMDGHAFQSRNLAPRKNQDKLLSVNATLRQQLGKQAGDTVRVTLYRAQSNGLSNQADVLACLEDAAVLALFHARNADEQHDLLQAVLDQPDAIRQEKSIVALIASLSNSLVR
jgi:citrate lyase gamma subunit